MLFRSNQDKCMRDIVGYLLKAATYGYANGHGQLVIEPKWDGTDRFSEGLAPVKRASKYGYIDKQGQAVIEPKWDGADGFSEGLAAVKRGSKWGYIDKQGQVVIETEWDKVRREKDSAGGVYFQVA